MFMRYCQEVVIVMVKGLHLRSRLQVIRGETGLKGRLNDTYLTIAAIALPE